MLSSIIFTSHPFQPLSVSLLRVVLFWSVLLSMLLNYKKLSWCLIDWQLSVLNVNGHTYSYPLPPLWQWGLKLDLNSIEGVIIHFSVPENDGFDTIISEYFYRLPFLYGCGHAHKQLFLAAICSSNSWDLLTRIRSLSLLHELLIEILFAALYWNHLHILRWYEY